MFTVLSYLGTYCEDVRVQPTIGQREKNMIQYYIICVFNNFTVKSKKSEMYCVLLCKEKMYDTYHT